MRTTVRLDDVIFQRAKEYAVEHGTTFTALLREALQEKLARDQSGGGKPIEVALPTFRGRGIQPGVDLHDTAALLDLMERADS